MPTSNRSQRNQAESERLSPASLNSSTKFVPLTGNQLTNVTMPGSLTALSNLDLAVNRLGSVTLPSGLTNLTSLDLFENKLTSLTLPPDMVRFFAV